jgi:hypothetical protein
VNLKTGECSCPDRTPAGEIDKHLAAATIFRAKSRAKARRERAAPASGTQGGTRQPRVSRGGSVRAILAGLLFAAPSYFLLFVLAGG